MASQMVATSGNRRLRRDQIAELNAKQGSLKNLLAQRQQQEFHDNKMSMQNKEFKQKKKQDKKSLALQERADMLGMGVSAAKFGFGLASNKGSTTFGEIGEKVKGGLGSIFGSKGTSSNAGTPTASGMMAPASSSSGFFGDLSPGKLLGSGLAGFGASRFVKGKGKRALLGAGIGGLMSMFGGGGFSAAGFGAGAMFGGLAGLF